MPYPSQHHSRFGMLLVCSGDVGRRRRFLVFRFLPVLDISLVPVCHSFIPSANDARKQYLLRRIAFKPIQGSMDLFIR